MHTVHRLRQRQFAALLLILLTVASCAKTVRPNAVSEIDDTTYTFLTIAQASLSQASADLKAGAIPAEALPYFNTAVDAYNKTRTVWLDYRERKASNQNLSDAMALLQGAIGQLNRKIGRIP